MKKMVNYISRYVGLVGVILLLVTACAKEEIEVPTIRVEFAPENPSIGETVTFTVFHDAQYLSVYPGDSAHEWERSLAYAELNGGNTESEFLQEMTPNTDYYYADFRVLGDAGESIPAAFQTHNLEVAIDYDEIYYLWALKLSNPAENTDSLTLIIENPGSYLWGEVDPNPDVDDDSRTLEMDIRMADSMDVQITIYLEMGEQMTSVGNAFTRTVSEGSMLYGGQSPNERTDVGYEFDLENLIDQWVIENPDLAQDSVEVTQLVLVFESMDGSPRDWSDIFISFLKLGYPDLRPFDTGYNINITDLGGVQTFEYIYQDSGAFTPMFIATNVDYISRTVDYTDAREPSAEEYDYLRAFFDLTVDVSGSVD